MVSLFLSFKYLRSKNTDRFISLISWFSFIGIVLGVATLIVVTSVMNGFREELLSKILTVTGDIVVVTNAQNNDEAQIIKQQLKQKSYIKEVWGYVEGQALTVHNHEAIGLMIRGTNRGFFKVKSNRHSKLIEGNFKNLAIGRELQQRLNLSINDPIMLVSPNFSNTLFGSIPKITSYDVSGIFQFNMYQYDNSLIFMPLQIAEQFLGKNTIDGFSIFLHDTSKVYEYTKDLRQIPGIIAAKPWGNANQLFFDTLRVEKNVMFIILTLIVIVAAFNIISGQVMFVKDHMHNVAILKALGASKRFIMQIFFITGSFVGVMGTVVGTIIGILLSLYLNTLMIWVEDIFGVQLFHAEVYYLSSLPTNIHTSDVMVIVCMTLIITFIAALYPAYRASRLEPSQILRHD